MVLRVSTDASGLESPIQGLKQLNIPFKHVWASDIDQHCIKQIKANFKPQILFGDPDGPYPDGDIRRRDNTKLPNIDLYISGPPCQAFSQMGRGLGFKDPRGNVFFACIDVIKKKKPRMFILENVKGLLSNDKGRTWGVIWCELQKLEKFGYNVDWKLLNTRHYGIPHNRERIYIIGKKRGNITWPEKCKMKDIKTFVDHHDKKSYTTSETIQNYINTRKKNTFLNLEFHGPTKNTNPHYISCIMKGSGIWCVPMKRWANTNELSSLQGIDIKNVVSSTTFKGQIGNSMSVNVLKAIFKCNL